MDTSLNNKSVRAAFYILIVFNSILVLWRLYSWSQGTETIWGIGVPLGFVLLLLGVLIGETRKTLYNVLLGGAVLAVLAGLAGLIANWR